MGRSWKDNGKYIFSILVTDGNLSIVAGNDTFGNGKTEAKMPVVFPGFICAVKAFKQLVPDVFRNGITGIGYGEKKPAVPDAGMNGDCTMFRGIT